MRRPTKRKVWLEGMTPAANANGAFNSTPWIGGTYQTIPIVSSTQIEQDLDGDGGLLRLVGDLFIQVYGQVGVSNSSYYAITAGIMQVQEDQTGAMSAQMSPMNAVANEFKWLWQKTYLVTPFASTASTFYPSGFESSGNKNPWQPNQEANLDVKVRRRLRTGMPIAFFFDLHFLPANFNVTAWGNIRALCSH